jgi:peptide/nickel transport system substrate-binding protein
MHRTALSRRTFAQLAGASAGLLATGGLALGPTGRSGEARADEAAPTQVIVAMNTESEPSAGFDPLMSWGCGEHVHEPLIQSTLITTNTDLEFVNDLATSYECSDDGLTWTFTIRDDVRFTDGEPLTARDVAFTINGVNESAGSEADLSMVELAEATDDTTVVLHMAKPYNALLYTLAVLGIVPEHAYDENYGANPVGSGRYMLEQWDRGQQVILKANPDYYGEKPLMERVVVVFMEEDAALAAARSGQVDIAYTSATLADFAPDGYDLLACSTVDSRGISLPCVPAGTTKDDGDATYPQGNDVTCDVAVRRAMNYGLDRTAAVTNVLNGWGIPAYSVGDGMPWSSPDMACDYDPDYALQLLEEAGWVAGADGVREKDGVRASVELYYAASDSVRQALSADFANQMAPLGIEVNIHGASWDDIYPHEFSDLILWGWGSNAPVETYELTYSSGWGNFASYENETVDAYLDEALAQTDVADSYEYWQKAQWDGEQGVAPQGASTWVWIANVDHLYFARTGLNVAEQKPHPHGHGWSLVNNVDRWTWEA